MQLPINPKHSGRSKRNQWRSSALLPPSVLWCAKLQRCGYLIATSRKDSTVKNGTKNAKSVAPCWRWYDAETPTRLLESFSFWLQPPPGRTSLRFTIVHGTQWFNAWRGICFVEVLKSKTQQSGPVFPLRCAFAQYQQTICAVLSHSSALQHSTFNTDIYISHIP